MANTEEPDAPIASLPEELYGVIFDNFRQDAKSIGALILTCKLFYRTVSKHLRFLLLGDWGDGAWESWADGHKYEYRQILIIRYILFAIFLQKRTIIPNSLHILPIFDRKR
jgi:hypothetical protein